MTDLVILPCSMTKNRSLGGIPALERYDGPFFRTLRKAMEEEVLREDLRFLILSAKHGIVELNDKILWYDQVMTPERAKELREGVGMWEGWGVEMDVYNFCNHEKVFGKIHIFCAGTYLEALKDMTGQDDIEIIKGGIGEKAGQLKKLIRKEVPT